MNQHTHGSFEDNFQSYRKKPDGSADPAGEAGWFLQRERERRKVNLRDVAQAIRVHPIHLDAIERGDLTRMPHRSDAIGMVGAYAEFLGFDPQPMMMHYAQVIPKQVAPKQNGAKTPSPLGSARIIEFPLARRIKELTGSGGGVVASICAAVMLFGGVAWAVFPNGSTSEQEQIASTPNGTVAGEQGSNTNIAATIEKSEGQLNDASSAVAIVDPSADSIGALLAREADQAANGLAGLDKLIASNGRIEGQTDSLTTATIRPVESVAKPAKIDNHGRIFGADNTEARLVLRATAPVWLRVEDGKGKAILTETLMKGDRFRVPDLEGLVVIARDGGLLTFEIDGKPWGNLGNPGEILVNRALDINTLMNRGG
jgi:cytoskeleton protein RodZ